MRSVGFGDLAASYQGSLQSTGLKTEMARLSQELASGRRADLKAGAGSDLSKYAGIKNALNSLAAYKFSSQDAALLLETAQSSLSSVREQTTKLAPELLTYGNIASEPGVTTIAADGRRKFDSIVATLNTRVADRSLFSGASIDQPALADTETMISALGLAVAAETTAAGIESVVDAWFDDVGGGFETTGYLGATTDLAPLALGQNETATFGVRADDQAVRDLLKGYAMISLVAEGVLPGDLTERASLVALAGNRLIQANDSLGDTQANLGVVQEQVEVAQTRNAAETTALQIAETKIVEADPFRVATELQAAEIRLETLFAVTARLSRLSLVNYLS